MKIYCYFTKICLGCTTSAEEDSVAAVFHFPEDFRNAGKLHRTVRSNKNYGQCQVRCRKNIIAPGDEDEDEEKISLKHFALLVGAESRVTGTRCVQHY